MKQIQLAQLLSQMCSAKKRTNPFKFGSRRSSLEGQDVQKQVKNVF